MKINLKNIIFLIVIIAVVITAVSIYTSSIKKDEEFLSSDILDLFEKNLVTSFVVDGELNLSLNAYVIQLDQAGNELRHPDGSYILETDPSTGNPKIKTYTHKFKIFPLIHFIIKISKVNVS